MPPTNQRRITVLSAGQTENTAQRLVPQQGDRSNGISRIANASWLHKNCENRIHASQGFETSLSGLCFKNAKADWI
jgi:hypothetical protein